MNTLVLPAAVMAVGAFAAFLLRRKPLAAAVAGSGLLCCGALGGLVLLVSLFYKECGFNLNNLFLFPVMLLALAAAIHSLGYLAGHGSERSGSYWCFFNLTVAAMIMVTQAGTELEFLLAWEVMGAASFALVIFDRDTAKTWNVGWIYLLACHAGAAFLILLFCFPAAPAAMFILALIGFGLKIGFPLLHVWLPEAHPTAPAPVSALMSGAMIELGFFGILIYGVQPGDSSALYGWIFTVLGLITAILGIIFALAQNNLKKLLAYSSIENMGILSTALGLGFLGYSYKINTMMIGGFAGAGAHLLNHALLKGGLFLAAGSVYKAVGTLDMDKMGGLLKRMPRTGLNFILHGLALCGLPPSSGFAAEFFIYCAAFCGMTSGIAALQVISAAALVVLALTGGLAAAAFSKAIGAVFCGEPRSQEASTAKEVPMSMNLPVLVLFLLSLILMFALPVLVEFCGALLFPQYQLEIAVIVELSAWVVSFSFGAIVLMSCILMLRKVLVKCSGQRVSPTWDCGYSRPDARMEYTATSFGRTMVDFFRFWLRPERKISRPQGIFPETASLEEEIPDGGISCFWQPIFKFLAKIADKIHVLQSGSLHFYLLVLVLTLMLMLGFAVIRGN